MEIKNIKNVKILDIFDMKEKDLKKYIILDKSIIFEENKHIDNIIKYFIHSLKLPNEIKNNIGKYILCICQNINLKIFDYLIEYNKKTADNFILTNNNINYIKHYLKICNYNVTLFYPQKFWNIKNSNKYLIFKDTNKYIYEKRFKNKTIKTCFDIQFFNIDIKIYDIENFYNNGGYLCGEKILVKLFTFVTFYVDPWYIEKLLEENINLNNKYICIKDFLYSLIKHMHFGNAVIIILDNNYIIIGHPYFNNFKYIVNNVLILEISKFENIGKIVIPYYFTLDQIIKNRYKMKLYKKIKSKKKNKYI